MKTMYKMRKVFDCQDMPDLVIEAFLYCCEGAGNDVVVEWVMENPKQAATTPEYDKVYNWLIEKGAEENECILIKHWW
jgi:hypothetical protein